MNELTITTDPAVRATDAFGTAAVVRVERATARGGSYVEVGTVAVPSSGITATYFDAAGTTTHWYRTRYSDVPATKYSEYGPEFQADAFTPAYATPAEFAARFDIAPPAGRLDRIASALEEASATIEAEIGWDFYQHPATGTEQRTFDVSRAGRRLCVHSGIVSLTTVEVRDTSTSAWRTAASGDWYLDPRYPLAGESAAHVVFTGDGTETYFPAGRATVRLTGVFGYAAVPPRVRAATIALARQAYRADSTIPGGMVGPDEMMAGTIPRAWPDETYSCIRYYRTLYWCGV